jgi:hypothetical protein
MGNKQKVVTVAEATRELDGIRKAATMAGRAIARLEANAAEVHAEATNKRGFQAVSSKDGFSALIRHGRTLFEIQGDDFAVRQTD